MKRQLCFVVKVWHLVTYKDNGSMIVSLKGNGQKKYIVLYSSFMISMLVCSEIILFYIACLFLCKATARKKSFIFQFYDQHVVCSEIILFKIAFLLSGMYSSQLFQVTFQFRCAASLFAGAVLSDAACGSVHCKDCQLRRRR